MGAFKPLLPFGDKTVVETCVNNLRAAGIQEIVVVVGHRAADIKQRLSNSGVSFALNSDPDSEMNVSIARGVELVDNAATAVLIALVDHPAVPPQIIAQIIDEWQRGEAKLIQPEHEGHGGHPVLVDLAFRQELLNLDPQRGLRALFDRHREQVRRLPVDSSFVARDMDRWEDYLRLHQDCFGRLPAES
jgi:CTP:molybdopterin cytidylyltransferase MocA